MHPHADLLPKWWTAEAVGREMAKHAVPVAYDHRTHILTVKADGPLWAFQLSLIEQATLARLNNATSAGTPAVTALDFQQPDLTYPPDRQPVMAVLAPLNTPSSDCRVICAELPPDGHAQQIEMAAPVPLIDRTGNRTGTYAGYLDQLWTEDGLLQGSGVLTDPEAVARLREAGKFTGGVDLQIQAAREGIPDGLPDDSGDHTLVTDWTVQAFSIGTDPLFPQAVLVPGLFW